MKRNLGIAALALAVLAGGAVGYLLLFPADESTPVTVATAAPPRARPLPAPAVPDAGLLAASFEIVETTGVVEVRRDGAWVPARAGDHVLATEAIRTGAGGAAVLRTTAGDQLALREKVELEVGQLDRSVTELTLTRGKVKARAAPGSERFAIATTGGARAVGRQGARFTVYAAPRGAVAVASEEGDVTVIGGGREVTLGPNEQTYVPAGGTPRDPAPVPDEVLVTVAWPAGEVHARRTTVKGRAAPGAIVRVNGQDAVVQDDGTFSTDVPLREGPNSVEVVAENLDGKTARQSGKIKVDTRGPPVVTDPTHMYDPPPDPKKQKKKNP